MKMKKIIALLVAAMMAGGLVACGGGDADEKGGGTEGDLNWSAGADDSGGEVTLRVATWRKYDKEYYEEIIRRFQEKYDWITVELEINADSGSYYSNLQADLIGGTAPDVFDHHPNSNIVVYAKEGMIAPQTDFEYMKNYKENAKEITTFLGENYGFMNAYNYFGCLYNIDIFNEVGVSVPTTPDELIEVVDKLKAAGYGGISFAGATNGAGGVANPVFLESLGTENYAKFQEGIDNGSITDISTVEGVPEALDTLQAYTEHDTWYTAVQGISYEASVSLYAQKKAAILYGGSYILGEGVHFPDIKTGYFPLPVYGKTGVTYAEGAQTTLINAAGKNLGAAKLWVEFLASPEIAEFYCTNTEMMSTIEGVEVETDNLTMLRNSCQNYVIGTIVEQENSEYWSGGFNELLRGVVFEDKDWKDLVKIYTNKLEDYDLSRLSN